MDRVIYINILDKACSVSLVLLLECKNVKHAYNLREGYRERLQGRMSIYSSSLCCESGAGRGVAMSCNFGPSSLVAIPAIAWASSLNRTTVARAAI